MVDGQPQQNQITNSYKKSYFFESQTETHRNLPSGVLPHLPPQKTATAGNGLVRAQNQELLLGFDMGDRAQASGHHVLACQVHQQEAGTEADQPGLKAAPGMSCGCGKGQFNPLCPSSLYKNF